MWTSESLPKPVLIPYITSPRARMDSTTCREAAICGSTWGPTSTGSWATATAASSARIYYESRHAPPAAPRRVAAPTACADFPKEVIWSPRKWLEARYNITRWTAMPRGGHFAALEAPGLLVDDIRAFFRDLR